jgi:sugar-specific transcriptional regulator TrmB
MPTLEMDYSDVEKDVIRELIKLGLSENEAFALLFLMTHDNSTLAQISRVTGISQDQVRQDLRQLSSLEIVAGMNEPEQYSALPIQEVFDKLGDRRKNQV